MGERAQKVVIRLGRVGRFWSQWGGQQCAESLVAGTEGLEADLSESKRADEWMEADLAEGGYLVDFDAKRILLYSWDLSFLESIEAGVRSAWPGWAVSISRVGVPEFREYVGGR